MTEDSRPDRAAALSAGSGPVPALRFGLVGTGHWARVAHAPAVASTPGIEFTAVWGRNPEAAGAIAGAHQVAAYGDFGDFLGAVDAVAFSVPPTVQSTLGVIAAEAGKHLLLEKPIALSEADSDALVQAADDAGVASVVFFTSRFQPDARAWLTDVRTTGGWAGGSATWLGSVYSESSPFNTPWRRDKGALWDLGPHVVSLLWACLGPVSSVSADVGQGDLTHLVFHHRGGATSSATLTLGAPEAADGFELQLWGTAGRTRVPPLADDPVPALRLALTELAGNVAAGRTGHPCDVHFGRDVSRVLAQAQDQIDVLRSWH